MRSHALEAHVKEKEFYKLSQETQCLPLVCMCIYEKGTLSFLDFISLCEFHFPLGVRVYIGVGAGLCMEIHSH